MCRRQIVNNRTMRIKKQKSIIKNSFKEMVVVTYLVTENIKPIRKKRI